MTHEKIATFYLAMGWQILKIWYSRARKIYNERIRRHADRYYRVGRHRPAVIGYRNLAWANRLVAQLREDRQFVHHQVA